MKDYFFFYRWFSKVLLKKRVVVKEKRAEVLSGIIDELRKMDLEKKITGDAYSSKMKEYKGELSEIRKDLAILEKRIPVK